MPELPDLAILADATHASLRGRLVLSVATPQSLVVRGTPHELRALEGQRLTSVARRGKFLVFLLERDRLVLNAMLSGRLGLARPGTRALPRTAVVIAWGPRPPRVREGAERDGTDAAVARDAAWTIGAPWLPPDDEPVELRYRDATRMGKLYVIPSGVERQVAGWQEQGPDADDPALDLDTWRRRIARHRGEVKGVLRDQSFVAGIGNAYSDEILWDARLAPFRKRSSLATDEVDALYESTRRVLPESIAVLRERVPPRFEVEVRDHLKVHGKRGTPCPRCGATISEVSAGGFVTNFCRSCQR